LNAKPRPKPVIEEDENPDEIPDNLYGRAGF